MRRKRVVSLCRCGDCNRPKANLYSRQHLLAGLLLLLTFLGGCKSPDASAVKPEPPTASTVEPNYAPGDYYVDHIVDGDTLWLKKDGKEIKVRLLRIDTPEDGDFGYREATEELQRQLGDESKIQIEFEEERLDQHGRTLAYLFVDGKNVNLEMVRTGWSAFFDRYGKGRYAKEFRAAESEARTAKAGIWAGK